ncbi:MAG: signal transduction protein [Syntrophobacterales bacterium RIFOXYC2_FULL_60_23]|nr:MAG: signal transduction protein [Syntrophobacterales bacterium RIFOXYC2_FULL_60_23]
MDITAREVMDTRYSTLSPQMTIGEAFRVFQTAAQEHQQTVFGMVVTDAAGQLLGMLSLYDLLLLIRPKHIHIWGEIKDVEISGILDAALSRARSMLVSDVMTTDLTTITPDMHLLRIIDIMIKKHVRRLPVLEDGKMVGIVYLSRVFQHLLERSSA